MIDRSCLGTISIIWSTPQPPGRVSVGVATRTEDREPTTLRFPPPSSSHGLLRDSHVMAPSPLGVYMGERHQGEET